MDNSQSEFFKISRVEVMKSVYLGTFFFFLDKAAIRTTSFLLENLISLHFLWHFLDTLLVAIIMDAL